MGWNEYRSVSLQFSLLILFEAIFVIKRGSSLYLDFFVILNPEFVCQSH